MQKVEVRQLRNHHMVPGSKPSIQVAQCFSKKMDHLGFLWFCALENELYLLIHSDSGAHIWCGKR